MAASSSDRVRRHRERRDDGKVMLFVCVDEQVCMQVLSDMSILHQDRDYSTLEMARGVGQLLEVLAKTTRN